MGLDQRKILTVNVMGERQRMMKRIDKFEKEEFVRTEKVARCWDIGGFQVDDLFQR